jgi:hypothetical protein
MEIVWDIKRRERLIIVSENYKQLQVIANEMIRRESFLQNFYYSIVQCWKQMEETVLLH